MTPFYLHKCVTRLRSVQENGYRREKESISTSCTCSTHTHVHEVLFMVPFHVGKAYHYTSCAQDKCTVDLHHAGYERNPEAIYSQQKKKSGINPLMHTWVCLYIIHT